MRSRRVLDDGNIYNADSSGPVLKAPLAGGAVATIATGQVNPDAIAVDETSVYWIDNSSTSPRGHQRLVMRLRGAGATPLAFSDISIIEPG
jgi:hypothetical protein